MRQALVTGSEGFVGRHFVRWLTEHRWNVLGLDIVTGQDCRTWFRRDDFTTRFDLVVHAAAVVGGRVGIDHRPLQVATDAGIDAELFAWAARTGQRHVVYPSSSAAYPVELQTGVPPYRLRESDLDLTVTGPADATYGEVKVFGERLAQVARDAGVGVHVIRPFSGYGTDQSVDYPFPAFVGRALDRADPFTIWGNGYQVRDFIHIDDIVGATMAMVADGIPGPVNLGSGRPVEFVTLAEMICEAAGYRPTWLVDVDAPMGVAYRVADPTLMEQFYRPKVSLPEGIARAVGAAVAY